MIKAIRAKDDVAVRLVIERIWEDLSQDGLPFEEFDPDMEDSIWLEVWKDDKKLLGVYKIHHYEENSVMGHANVLQKYRGEYTEEITKAVAAWMEEHLDKGYEKLIVCIPINKPNVLKYAERIGFEEESKVLGMALSDFYKYGRE